MRHPFYSHLLGFPGLANNSPPKIFKKPLEIAVAVFCTSQVLFIMLNGQQLSNESKEYDPS